ncbi:ABC transporter ATP-binding protein [Sedimentitalea nanhaiensis]|uniref:Peptide/nickel transport system ATP-binding protein n=1 Tax=Sedimentitalea nanhaiensis TaxID=999627 RepID=A0A1I7BUI2_9RHOB|nr:ABC transporter ATP-binding protein [Sedimentitalea nanhaiensis]SFT90809.1 peptide/nickel transport system ATP-binding protein [Sedimentitalea nanhaiensis]
MSAPVLLDVRNLSVKFPMARSRMGLGPRRSLNAVSDVSMRVAAGETVGLVGESGSGKSTFGRAILRLGELTRGEVLLDGQDMARARGEDLARLRRETAMIFQDPYGSLNPRLTVRQAIGEVLHVHGKKGAAGRDARIVELLELVGLDATLMDRRPGDLSGGQCQRIGIARALAIEPRLIVADECVAALDVSIQGQIINLLMELGQRMHLGMIFIAHDLAMVRRLCDRIAVMYLGRIVEEGPTEQVFKAPRHPYTRSLIEAIPEIDPARMLPSAPLPGEPPSPVNLPEGCAFHPRCPLARSECRTAVPPFVGGAHRAACILAPGGRLNEVGENLPETTPATPTERIETC